MRRATAGANTTSSSTTSTTTSSAIRSRRPNAMHVIARSKQALSRSRRAIQAQKIKERAKKLGNILTRSRAFRTLVDWAYEVCDPNRTGEINKDELYAGLLLVHIRLAKFAGPAACFPPSRKIVGDLFEASDADNSGGICRQEFNIISSVCCAQILSRILLNYATMIFVIPFVARKIVDRLGVSQGTYMEMVCEQIAGLILFLLVIPILWSRIDREANQTAKREAERQRSFRKLNTTDDNDDDVGSVASSSLAPPSSLKKDDDDDDYEDYDKNSIRTTTDGESAASDVSCPALDDADDGVVVLEYPRTNKKDD